VASLAYQLSGLQEGEEICLPRERIAEWLTVSPATVSRIVRLLVGNGILKSINENYSYKDGIAKTYKFVATTVLAPVRTVR
jgi:DNA-binding Lrp family transcriptional regulator